MGSVDLIDCQVGRREVPNFQVGRGKEMRLSESLTDSIESSYQRRSDDGKDSCGFVDHVNEYDEKLNTLTIEGGGSEEYFDHWGNSYIPTR
jgi:hypothetical protein